MESQLFLLNGSSKIKHVANESIEKYKARFVAKDSHRKKGLIMKKFFASVARYTSARTIIAIVVSKGWKIHQIDVINNSS